MSCCSLSWCCSCWESVCVSCGRLSSSLCVWSDSSHGGIGRSCLTGRKNKFSFCCSSWLGSRASVSRLYLFRPGERSSVDDGSVCILLIAFGPKRPRLKSQACIASSGVLYFGSTICTDRGILLPEEPVVSLQGFLTTCWDTGLPPHTHLNAYFIPSDTFIWSLWYAKGPD